MELKFRDLRPDEVECRVGTAKDGKGISLLLYKDARCDQNILDETVGAMNWQRKHTRDNANCILSIWDDEKKMWVEKEDTGTESNTEKEKGLASDSFKRAAFNWGIGRELYTAPFIWISGASKYDKFWVREMTVENKRITTLTICRKDDYGNKLDDVAYQFPKGKRSGASKSQQSTKVNFDTGESDFITSEQAASIKSILEQTESDVKAFLRYMKANSVDEIRKADYKKAQDILQRKIEKLEAERQGA